MGEKLFTTDISGGLRSRETLADHLEYLHEAYFVEINIRYSNALVKN